MQSVQTCGGYADSREGKILFRPEYMIMDNMDIISFCFADLSGKYSMRKARHIMG